jgi:stearoyl-CoA desaturase (Delta-9 desaturase)
MTHPMISGAARAPSIIEPPAALLDTASVRQSMFIHYPALVYLSITHLMALACFPYMYFYGAPTWEAAFHLLAYPLGGFGITALYHRSWAHNAVRFARPVEYVLAIMSVFALQMPARQWISTHIKHHQHTDHDQDPYNIQRGFWWAHFEWIIFAQVPPIELPDRLNNNRVVLWQERYYWPLAVLLNIVIPIALSIAVGSPWWGGLLLSGLRLVFTSNVVYAVNSVCHMRGSRPFTKEVSARDVWWFPFSLGEQYHNYHHAFPRDYRHGVDRFAFDPTKWLISILARAGLAHNLFAMPNQRVQESRYQALAGRVSGVSHAAGHANPAVLEEKFEG